MRKSLVFAVALLFVMAAALYTQDAQATPGFARQTGMACNTCHFQHFPTLNAFGRAFKSTGYTMKGAQALVEGDHLSIPSSLNIAMLTKIRYQKRNGDSKAPGASAGNKALNKGEVQFPDEVALLVGGRGGDHAGFLLEMSLLDGDSRFTSFKVPLVFEIPNVKDLRFLAIPFTTDSQGAAYSFELLNSAIVPLQRPFEHGPEVFASRFVFGKYSATGGALVVTHPSGYLNLTSFAPDRGSYAPNIVNNMWIRAAATPDLIPSWDLGLGVQFYAGTGNVGGTGNEVYTKTAGMGVDLQAQGEAGGIPVGVYIGYANAPKSGDPAVGETAIDAQKRTNKFNTATGANASAKSAVSFLAEVGVLPGRLTTSIGYLAGHTGNKGAKASDSSNAFSIGAVYELMQNVEFVLNHTWYSGDQKPGAAAGSNLTTLMLESAF